MFIKIILAKLKSPCDCHVFEIRCFNRNRKINTRVEDLVGKAAKYFVNLSSQPIKAFIKNLFINYQHCLPFVKFIYNIPLLGLKISPMYCNSQPFHFTFLYLIHYKQPGEYFYNFSAVINYSFKGFNLRLPKFKSIRALRYTLRHTLHLK